VKRLDERIDLHMDGHRARLREADASFKTMQVQLLKPLEQHVNTKMPE
jgi:hypothetical protein